MVRQWTAHSSTNFGLFSTFRLLVCKLATANHHQDGHAILFPRCLRICVRNLWALSLAHQDWKSALSFQEDFIILSYWCADVSCCRISALSYLADTCSCCKQLCWERLVLSPAVCTAPTAGLHSFCWVAGIHCLSKHVGSVMSWSWAGMASCPRRGPGSPQRPLQGMVWSPGCPGRHRRAPSSSLHKGIYWRFATPRTAYGMGREGSLAVSLSISGASNTQDPGSKQVKKGKFLTQWIADV